MDFLIFSILYFEYCLSSGGYFPFFFVIFVGGVCLSIYYTCHLFCLFWVCWVRENFSGGPGHIFSVWDSAVWSAGPVQVYLGTILEWMADCTDFSFLWFCCSGYGTVVMVGGWSVFLFIFFSLLSALLACGCLW